MGDPAAADKLREGGAGLLAEQGGEVAGVHVQLPGQGFEAQIRAEIRVDVGDGLSDRDRVVL